ncbi:hypothetical protein F5Y14DRAFT_281683 [Nemania sp. NC0429]|nr:hypothetical protein F5Y14DRAFT_281683 [Nemania sp. NC0429]
MAVFRYLSLHSNPGALLPQFPSYVFASQVQTVLQQELLAWKARPPSSRGPPPPPSLICFTPAPTYTLGRRQAEPLSESEVAQLRSPLFVSTSSPRDARIAGDADRRPKSAFFLPAIDHAPRGGLATYHGPGQLVVWPVIDLHSPLHQHLTVRDYACLLEKTTIAALEKQWGLAGFTTENPGVWVRSGGSRRGAGAEERKIAALGVHLRRHVTGLGVAINYSTPVAGPAETNPWARIVACGLEDRGVTNACVELGLSSGNDNSNDDKSALESLADTWSSEFQKRLKIHPDADSMVSFDAAQSLKDLDAQFKHLADSPVRAYPVSNLQT